VTVQLNSTAGNPSPSRMKIAFFLPPCVTLRPPFVTKMFLISHRIVENEGNKFRHLGYKIILKHSRSVLDHIFAHIYLSNLNKELVQLKSYCWIWYNVHNRISSKTLKFEWIINGILFVIIESSYWLIGNWNEVSKFIVSNQVTKASKYQRWAWWIVLKNWAYLLGPKGMRVSPF
jgi:hypothetical protein